MKVHNVRERLVNGYMTLNQPQAMQHNITPSSQGLLLFHFLLLQQRALKRESAITAY